MENGAPILGDRFMELGARCPKDIPAKEPITDNSLVGPCDKGMSVAPNDPMYLSSLTRPKGQKQPVIFELELVSLPAGLVYVPQFIELDGAKTVRKDHGYIGPDAPMTLLAFRMLLRSTVGSWKNI